MLLSSKVILFFLYFFLVSDYFLHFVRPSWLWSTSIPHSSPFSSGELNGRDNTVLYLFECFGFLYLLLSVFHHLPYSSKCALSFNVFPKQRLLCAEELLVANLVRKRLLLLGLSSGSNLTAPAVLLKRAMLPFYNGLHCHSSGNT